MKKIELGEFIQIIKDDMVHCLPFFENELKLDNPHFSKWVDELPENSEYYKAMDVESETQWQDYINFTGIDDELIKKCMERGWIGRPSNSKGRLYIPWYSTILLGFVLNSPNHKLYKKKRILDEIIKQLHIGISVLEETANYQENDIDIYFNHYATWKIYKIVNQKSITDVDWKKYKRAVDNLERFYKAEVPLHEFPEEFRDRIKRIARFLRLFRYLYIITAFSVDCELCFKGYSPNIIMHCIRYKELIIKKAVGVIRYSDIIDNLNYNIEQAFNYENLALLTDEDGSFRRSFKTLADIGDLILTPDFKIERKGKTLTWKIFNYGEFSSEKMEYCMDLLRRLKKCKIERAGWGELSGTKRLLSNRDDYMKKLWEYYRKQCHFDSKYSFEKLKG